MVFTCSLLSCCKISSPIQVMNKVRFVDGTAIISKTQQEIQYIVNRLVDSGLKYGMEINSDKSQVMRLSRNNESLQIKVNNRDRKKLVFLNSMEVC